MQGSFVRRSPLHLLRPPANKKGKRSGSTFQKDPCDFKGHTHTHADVVTSPLHRDQTRDINHLFPVLVGVSPLVCLSLSVSLGASVSVCRSACLGRAGHADERARCQLSVSVCLSRSICLGLSVSVCLVSVCLSRSVGLFVSVGQATRTNTQDGHGLGRLGRSVSLRLGRIRQNADHAHDLASTMSITHLPAAAITGIATAWSKTRPIFSILKNFCKAQHFPS